MARFGGKLKHAWNAFASPVDQRQREPFVQYYGGSSSGSRPDRVRVFVSNERSIIASIYVRLGVDVAQVNIRHVRTDDQNRYIEEIDSGLNSCLTLEANIDQAATMFRQDVAMSLFDYGCVAIVPVDTSISPLMSGGFDIKTLRAGPIVQWYPNHVRVNLYNDRTGVREEIMLRKRQVAIVENPLYSVMNEKNSTLQRVIRKLNLLDGIDDQSASGKLDLIIQLPYVVKSEIKRQQAEQRRKDVEFQLKGSKYGIAYVDGTEKIVQLNRPAENNLMAQIEYLMKMLYGQLGLTEEIMNGTADEKAMLNYVNRTIEPIVVAIVEAMRRSYLTKTARAQKQTIMFFLDAFKLVPLSEIAEIADAFTRNEILSSNEIRQILGIKPSSEPKADQLLNSNMPQPEVGGDLAAPDVMGSAFDDIEGALDDALSEFGIDSGGDTNETP